MFAKKYFVKELNNKFIPICKQLFRSTKILWIKSDGKLDYDNEKDYNEYFHGLNTMEEALEVIKRHKPVYHKVDLKNETNS